MDSAKYMYECVYKAPSESFWYSVQIIYNDTVLDWIDFSYETSATDGVKAQTHNRLVRDRIQ